MNLRLPIALTALVGAVMLAVEKPSLVSACHASHNVSTTAPCVCKSPNNGVDCKANSHLSIDEYRSGTFECTVRVSANWNCVDVDAALRNLTTGNVAQICGGNCQGTEWEDNGFPNNNLHHTSCSDFSIGVKLDDSCASTPDTDCLVTTLLRTIGILCDSP